MSTSTRSFLNRLTLAFLLLAGPAQAHLEPSAAEAADPLANLLDLYAFVTPCETIHGGECEDSPEELILALTLKPFATGADQFPDDIVYHFYVENESGDTSQIDCSFNPDQVVTCEGLDGRSVQARVGEVGTSDDLRVFAGLRDNPSFFDVEAFLEFQSIGPAAFEPPGMDFYKGGNALAIVLGIEISAIPASVSPGTNIQKIWAASERISGDGINGAISGSWYNPDQDGQGWLVEVIRRADGQDRFVVYFYGYEQGEQVWLAGTSSIEGDTATVNMKRTSGAQWGYAFVSDDVVREDVGTMEFRFVDCDNATVSFTPAGDTTLTTFSTIIKRLTQISSLECNLVTAGQIDRIGRRWVSHFFISGPMRDDYNAASEPADWDALFYAEIYAMVTTWDLADGIIGNVLGGDPQTLATMFVDDRLQIDLSQGSCTDYATIEMWELFGAPPEGCGGRTLLYDVADFTLGAVVSGFEPEVSDWVDANDVYFLSEFPYLAGPHFHGSPVTTGWPVSTPEAQGLAPTPVQALHENAEELENLYSVLVVKNGHLVVEEYFNGMAAHNDNPVASVTKSLMSALLGIAVREGVLTDLDQRMVDFFPEINWAQNDPRKGDITVRQMLQMRSGYPWEEFTGNLIDLANSSNWIPLLEDFPLSSNPGTQFNYSNLTAHMTSVILTRATGKSTFEFAKEHLFGPLELGVHEWPTDANGYYAGGGDTHMTPRDMARFGQLYLDGGVFNGEQIVPANWVGESLQTYSLDTYEGPILDSFGLLDYGYLWWSSSAGNHDFNFAWGHGGQLIVLVHDLDMVIVTTAERLSNLIGEDAWLLARPIMEMVGEFIASIP